MGMFDDISVSDALPYSDEMKELGIDINVRAFQTKDLENYMGHYFIQGGKLFERKYKVNEWVPGDENAKNFMDRLGYMKQEDEYLEQVMHHGEVYFYDFRCDVKDKWDCWIEFKAVFTNGIVDRYELIKFEKTDNAERLQRDKEWKAKLEATYNIWYNKYFFHTDIIRRLGMYWYRSCLAISNFFRKIA